MLCALPNFFNIFEIDNEDVNQSENGCYDNNGNRTEANYKPDVGGLCSFIHQIFSSLKKFWWFISNVLYKPNREKEDNNSIEVNPASYVIRGGNTDLSTFLLGFWMSVFHVNLRISVN